MTKSDTWHRIRRVLLIITFSFLSITIYLNNLSISIMTETIEILTENQNIYKEILLNKNMRINELEEQVDGCYSSEDMQDEMSVFSDGDTLINPKDILTM